MEPDHLLAELHRRIDAALAALEAAAEASRRLDASIAKTGLNSDASRALADRVVKLADEYHERSVELESVRRVLEARTKCRGAVGKTPVINS